MADVAAYTDSDPITARGTPMARPKIGSSIVDVIGRTPMVIITRHGISRNHAGRAILPQLVKYPMIFSFID